MTKSDQLSLSLRVKANHSVWFDSREDFTRNGTLKTYKTVHPRRSNLTKMAAGDRVAPAAASANHGRTTPLFPECVFLHQFIFDTSTVLWFTGARDPISLAMMFKYNLINLIVLLAAYVRQTCIGYPFQISGATIAVTGYFAHIGVYQAQAIKNNCYGNWRHADVNCLQCSLGL